MALGAVKIPINPVLSPSEIDKICQRIRPDCVVTGDDLADRLAESGWRGAQLRIDHRKAPSSRSREEVADTLGSLHGAPADSPAVIFFSSGTTGTPKGIVHSQAGITAMMWLHLMESGIAANDVVLLTTPLAHAAGGFLNTALLRGATARIEEKFSTEAYLTRVQEDRASWTFIVPTILFRILAAAEHSERDTSSLRTIQYGASPIAPDLLRRAMARFGPVLQQLYGLTECPNYISQLSKDDHTVALSRTELMSSAGKPCLWSNVTIRNEQGEALAVNEPGEVCVEAPFVMVDYWEDAEGYSNRFHGQAVRTGDIGYLDDDGYLHLMDRANDMIISGGMNVYSTEVENALSSHPWISTACVIGIPHEEWGESVQAFVVVTDPCAHDAATVIGVVTDYLRGILAPYKRPKSIEIIDQIPTTPYGKPDKKRLRAPYWGSAKRNIG